MIKNNNIVISQSITKDMGVYVIDEQVESVPFCPKKIWHMHFANDYIRVSKQIFIDGLYFETKLIGGSSRGEKTDTYPIQKNGKPYVAQTRLDRQVDRMHGYMKARGLTWHRNNTQVPLLAKYRENVWLRGEFDIFPTFVDSRLSIVDIKTTSNVNNDFFSFNDDKIGYTSASCWGKKNCLAKNQPLFYHFLARRFKDMSLGNMVKFRPDKEEMYSWLYSTDYDMEDCAFWFFVAGYKVGKEKGREYDVHESELDGQLTDYLYEYSPERELLLECLVETVLDRVRTCIRTDFKAVPSEKVCGGCGMKEVCFDSAVK